MREAGEQGPSLHCGNQEFLFEAQTSGWTELARQRGVNVSSKLGFTQTALCWGLKRGQCGQRPFGDKEMDMRRNLKSGRAEEAEACWQVWRSTERGLWWAEGAQSGHQGSGSIYALSLLTLLLALGDVGSNLGPTSADCRGAHTLHFWTLTRITLVS